MTRYPRAHIAAKISDLRQMRGALSELVITAHRMVAQAADMPEGIRQELAAADRADEIAQERTAELYNMPTPRAANATERAA